MKGRDLEILVTDRGILKTIGCRYRVDLDVMLQVCKTLYSVKDILWQVEDSLTPAMIYIKDINTGFTIPYIITKESGHDWYKKIFDENSPEYQYDNRELETEEDEW